MDHVFNLAVILSTKLLHSSLLSLLAVIGAPRYLKGSEPTENPVMCSISYSIFGLQHLRTILDLL